MIQGHKDHTHLQELKQRSRPLNKTSQVQRSHPLYCNSTERPTHFNTTQGTKATPTLLQRKQRVQPTLLPLRHRPRPFTSSACVWTYLCPDSCAMVKARPSPVSSFMVQLRYLLHIPLMGAKPTGRRQGRSQTDWLCGINYALLCVRNCVPSVSHGSFFHEQISRPVRRTAWSCLLPFLPISPDCHWQKLFRVWSAWCEMESPS